MTSHCKSFFLLCSNKNPCVIVKKILFKYEYSAERLEGINSLVCWEKGRAGRGMEREGSPPFNYNSMSWASSSEKSDMELSEEEFPPPSSCSLRASSVAYRWMYSERDTQSESEIDELVPSHINKDIKPLTQSQPRCVTSPKHTTVGFHSNRDQRRTIFGFILTVSFEEKIPDSTH